MNSFPFNLKMIGELISDIFFYKIKCWFGKDLLKLSAKYMHPYELVHNKPFWVSFSDLKNLSIFKNIYYQIRQHQWHSFNSGNLKKISNLLQSFPNDGPLIEKLKIKNT